MCLIMTRLIYTTIALLLALTFQIYLLKYNTSHKFDLVSRAVHETMDIARRPSDRSDQVPRSQFSDSSMDTIDQILADSEPDSYGEFNTLSSGTQYLIHLVDKPPLHPTHTMPTSQQRGASPTPSFEQMIHQKWISSVSALRHYRIEESLRRTKDLLNSLKVQRAK